MTGGLFNDFSFNHSPQYDRDLNLEDIDALLKGTASKQHHHQQQQQQHATAAGLNGNGPVHPAAANGGVPKKGDTLNALRFFNDSTRNSNNGSRPITLNQFGAGQSLGGTAVDVDPTRLGIDTMAFGPGSSAGNIFAHDDPLGNTLIDDVVGPSETFEGSFNPWDLFDGGEMSSASPGSPTLQNFSQEPLFGFDDIFNSGGNKKAAENNLFLPGAAASARSGLAVSGAGRKRKLSQTQSMPDAGRLLEDMGFHGAPLTRSEDTNLMWQQQQRQMQMKQKQELDEQKYGGASSGTSAAAASAAGGSTQHLGAGASSVASTTVGPGHGSGLFDPLQRRTTGSPGPFNQQSPGARAPPRIGSPIASPRSVVSNRSESQSDVQRLDPSGKDTRNPEDQQKLIPLVRSTLMTNRRALERRTLILRNPRVTQKSYGTEKRFCCPPPTAHFVGDGWTGGVDLTMAVGDDAEPQRIVVDEDGRAIAKNLYVSDKEGRRAFPVKADICTPQGLKVGVFESKPIKVISKPSKKKQSSKSSDLSIFSGTEVSLFNRLRSQTVSTKYLTVAQSGHGEGQRGRNMTLQADNTRWTSFRLHTVDPDQDDMFVPNIALRYGHHVVLECPETGMRSCTMLLLKVDKGQVYAKGNEPVSQLHKVAFAVPASSGGGIHGGFLGVSSEDVIIVDNDGSGKVSDSATWTITSTDTAQYSFYVPSWPPSEPLTPAPFVDVVRVQGSTVELHGQNLSRDLQVWFDAVPATTIFRSKEYIICVPPRCIEVTDGRMRYPPGPDPLEVRLTLVRDNGVIFDTGKVYSYMPQPRAFF
eukprot:Clim_evm7s247 gene=Clim_evmTU7s247